MLLISVAGKHQVVRIVCFSYTFDNLLFYVELLFYYIVANSNSAALFSDIQDISIWTIHL